MLIKNLSKRIILALSREVLPGRSLYAEDGLEKLEDAIITDKLLLRSHKHSLFIGTTVCAKNYPTPLPVYFYKLHDTGKMEKLIEFRFE